MNISVKKSSGLLSTAFHTWQQQQQRQRLQDFLARVTNGLST
jgi:hypothetical protein